MNLKPPTPQVSRLQHNQANRRLKTDKRSLAKKYNPGTKPILNINPLKTNNLNRIIYFRLPKWGPCGNHQAETRQKGSHDATGALNAGSLIRGLGQGEADLIPWGKFTD